VPLSEDEQRILSEIEDHLYESDPALAREVAQTTIYSHAFRRLKIAAVGFLAGMGIMVGLLSVSFLLSFVGVLAMLFSLLWFVDNLRILGRAGLAEMTSGSRVGLSGVFGEAGDKMRDRFRRSDDDVA
jgi:hypothetical protein